jgi:Bacterial protein of unknown function (DUF922)
VADGLQSRRLPLILAAILVIVPPREGSARQIAVRADPPRLAWSLFRQVDSIEGSPEDARIAAEMSFPQPLRMANVDGRYRLPSFTITVAPEPTRTMVRRSLGTSDALLRHEQGHYDIVILAARALARELESLTAPSERELSRLAEERVAEHTARAERVSEEYDRQTDRSRDSTAQARWNEMIAGALKDPAATHIAGLSL